MKRAVFRKGRYEIVYSDHFTIILYLKDLPTVNLKKEKLIRWNLKKEGGWERYKELSDDRSKDIEKLVDDDGKSIDQVFKGFERIDNDIKFKAFGKITLKDKKVIKVQKTKSEVSEEDAAKELLKAQSLRAEEELTKLRELKLGRAGNVFKIARSIQGPKKSWYGGKSNKAGCCIGEGNQKSFLGTL